MADNFYASYPVESGGSGSGVSSLNTLIGALTLAAGSNITLTPFGNTITIASSGGGGGSPGGSNLQLQYNNAGSFGGDTAVTDGGGNISLSSLAAGNLTANTALVSNSSKLIISSVTTATELSYVSGVTSAIQTQLNGKQASLTLGNLTDAGTDGIVITNGGGSVVGTGTSIAQHVADTTHNGYLSSTDWNTFNNKQSAGSYITALTGDGTASGSGSVAFTLATVNANTGAFGSSTSIPSFTVNAKGLITAAAGNVVIAPAGTLSGTTLNPTVVTSSLTSLGTQAQALNMGTHQITGVVDPTTAQMAATKNYVDTVASGLQPLQAVYAATIGSNIPGVYVSVGAGIGDTFTTTASTTFTLDGATPPLLSRILFKDQSAGYQNGVYIFTALPVNGVSGAVFTRALDYDTPSDVNAGDLIPVINGTVNTQTSWLQTANVTSIGPSGTALVFVQWTANPANYLLKANNLSDIASASTAINNILPVQTGNSGKFLTTNGSAASWGTAGGSNLNPTAKTANYTAVAGDFVLASSNPFTVTLPTAVGISGQTILIKKTDSALANIITIATTSSQTIDGAAPFQTLNTQNEEYTFCSDGSNWQSLQHLIPSQWVSWTPTFTGVGTVTTQSFASRRNGNELQVRGSGTLGTVSGVSNASISIGFNGTDGNVAMNTALLNSSILTLVGGLAVGLNGTFTWAMAASQSSTGIVFMTINNGGSNILNPTPGSNLANSGDVFSVDFSIPISGWNN